jgi:hypothetical protein
MTVPGKEPPPLEVSSRIIRRLIYVVREVSVNSAHGAFVFFDGLH